MSYASTTSVPVGRSKDEIEKTLVKYGASGFGSVTEKHRSCIVFGLADRRFRIKIQTKPEKSFRSAKHYEQAQRTIWRCALLIIKGRLEAVESGIETVEEAFLPHLMLPNGKTVGEVMVPQIASAYSDGNMPPLLGYSD